MIDNVDDKDDLKRLLLKMTEVKRKWPTMMLLVNMKSGKMKIDRKDLKMMEWKGIKRENKWRWFFRKKK